MSRVDYLVGGIRISVGEQSNTPGPRTHITAFVSALRAQGIDTDLFLASSAPLMGRFTTVSQSDYGDSSAARVWVADLVRIAVAVWTGLNLFARSLRRPAPDLIYERIAVLADLTSFHARKRRAFRVVEANGILHRETSADRKILKMVRLAAWLEARVMRKADLIVAVSEALRQEIVSFAGIDPAKILVVPNGVAANLAERASLRDPERLVLGFVGSLSAWQRLDRLLHAVARQRAALVAAAGTRQLAIEIVGDGAQATALRALSAELGLTDLVEFVGRLPHDEAMDRTATWTVGIAGHERSSSERMYHSPLKLYEYAALGVDLICTRSADAMALEASGVRCFYFDDDAQVEAALLSAVEAPPRSATEVAGVRAQVYADHSWQTRVNSVLEAATTGPELVVLLSLNPPDGTTRFVNQIAAEMPPGIRLRYFSWPTALFGRYDAFHLHWPEYRIRGGRLGGPAKRLLYAALLLRLKLTRTPLVRSLHNVSPHEGGSGAERALLQATDRATSVAVRLNVVTTAPAEIPASTPLRTVLHGHYRDVFSAHPQAVTTPGRLLYFGIIRPYKGVAELLATFAAMPEPELSLAIVGAPRDAGLRAAIEAACSADPRVSADLRFVPDDVLVHAVTSSELVVLPYREMHNSGVALVALSLGRPILVPRTEANTALALEVGADWVICFDGELQPEVIRAALAVVRAPGRSGAPLMDGRDWSAVGSQYAVIYREAVQATKGS
ncbi:glycosyltransferase [Jatrophihabitans sp.]|uniref:glycosyltransferase n=1 Tax=Jatrophihabitans sp. TaxID=1932789 RepID=UPI0030C6E9D4|nr:hypothetical protein [Jatrophihabitans sp.]